MDPLAREAEKFRKSSAYRHGDATSFSVPLTTTISLPGKTAPSHYLDTLGLKTLPKRVMVAGAANGGLVAEAFNRGAEDVVAVEARGRFQNPLRSVIALLAKARPEIGKSQQIKFVGMYPTTPPQQTALGQFDLIIWADGANEIGTPRAVLGGFSKCLAPGGKLVMEIRHGKHAFVDSINSWSPSSDGMRQAGDAFFGGMWVQKLPGRDGTSAVYVFQVAGQTKAEKPKKKRKSKKKTTAKKKTKKKVEKKPAPKVEETPPPPSEPADQVVTGKVLTEEDVEKAREIYHESRPMPPEPPPTSEPAAAVTDEKPETKEAKPE